MSMLLESSGLFDADRRARSSDGMPVFGTCAGMILLATDVLDGRPDQRSFGAIDIAVRRNGYGRQVDSFETDLDVAGLDDAVPRRVHPRPEGRVASAPASRCSPPRRRAGPRSPRARVSSHRSIPSSPATLGSTPSSFLVRR